MVLWNLLGKGVDWLAWLTAMSGGVVLLTLVGVTVVSITGRSLTGLGLGPVPGDFELVELGMGFAIFSFMPWCQLQRGHAVVDLLQGVYGRRGNRWLDVVAQLLMLVMAILLCWRLGLGMLDKKAYTETTYILMIPVWWAYLAAFVASVVMVVVAVKCLVLSVRDVRLPPANEVMV